MSEEGADLLHTAVIRRVGLVLTALWMGAGLGDCFAQEPRVHLAAQSFRLDISAQNLSAALKQFALQTGLQVARMNDGVDGDPIVGPLKGDLRALRCARTAASRHTLHLSGDRSPHDRRRITQPHACDCITCRAADETACHGN